MRPAGDVTGSAQRPGSMKASEISLRMQRRTTEFAAQVVKFFVKLPKTDEARELGTQLLRAGTSVARLCRLVARARSEAEYLERMERVVEEADQALLWLELLDEGGVCPSAHVASLRREADELVHILQTVLTTALRNAERV